MLLRLLPNEVTKYWQIIEASLKINFTKANIEKPEDFNNILKALLLGHLSCWLYRNENKVKGVILTSIIKDNFLQERNLLLYSVYTNSSLASEWIKAFETLAIYARSIKCKKIIFYTVNEKFLKIVKHLGASETHTVCEIPL